MGSVEQGGWDLLLARWLLLRIGHAVLLLAMGQRINVKTAYRKIDLIEG